MGLGLPNQYRHVLIVFVLSQGHDLLDVGAHRAANERHLILCVRIVVGVDLRAVQRVQTAEDVEGRVAHHHAWVSDIDGGELLRESRKDRSARATWLAPDGKAVTFESKVELADLELSRLSHDAII